MERKISRKILISKDYNTNNKLQNKKNSVGALKKIKRKSLKEKSLKKQEHRDEKQNWEISSEISLPIKTHTFLFFFV